MSRPETAIISRPGPYPKFIKSRFTMPISSPARQAPSTGLQDSKGKVFAFSDPHFNAGCIVPRFLLAQMGEDHASFFGKTILTFSHDNSIVAVSHALVDGAFVHEHIWQYYSLKNPAVTSKVRVIYVSEPDGNPPRAASALLPEALKLQIRRGAVVHARRPRRAPKSSAGC